MKLQELVHMTGYGFKTLVLGQKRPIIAGMPLTDVCNLRCEHFVIAKTLAEGVPFSRIETLIRNFYGIGVRIL